MRQNTEKRRRKRKTRKKKKEKKEQRITLKYDHTRPDAL